jgi:hypothetical protein
MIADIEKGTTTVTDLAGLKQEVLAKQYGTSRDTAVKARQSVLEQLRQNSDKKQIATQENPRHVSPVFSNARGEYEYSQHRLGRRRASGGPSQGGVSVAVSRRDPAVRADRIQRARIL